MVSKSNELESPYINAPVWPWAVAGWSLVVAFVLLFALARIYG